MVPLEDELSFLTVDYKDEDKFEFEGTEVTEDGALRRPAFLKISSIKLDSGWILLTLLFETDDEALELATVFFNLFDNTISKFFTPYKFVFLSELAD